MLTHRFTLILLSVIVGLLSTVLSIRPAGAVPPTNVFAGTWSGTWVNPSGPFEGVQTLQISPSGTFTGTFINLTNGITGTLRGHIDADGKFIVIGFIDNVPGGVALPTCGVFHIVNNHLVTQSWGIPENGCDEPDWHQDMVRQ